MQGSRGFSLVEVLMALAVMTAGVLAFSALVVGSRHAVVVSQDNGVAQVAAGEKLEELRSLAWTADAGVVPVSDWSTDLTITPPSSSGGTGLGSSSGDTLRANAAGFCDFLDSQGRWLGGGTSPPKGAAWVRRWMVQPLDTSPDLLVLQVAVVPVRRSGAAETVASARALNGAWLTTIRARRSR